ncbi:MAG: GTPase ObgE [Christensenellaceae bacterium]|jgi:GTP-binding protein|nr:GTPase ObgE [Christensenellaceae bacterium]
MFIDSVEIEIKAGSGGAGFVSFFRDTMTMFGGPNGGDGGKGGDVIFAGTTNVDNLVHFHYNQKFEAENGFDGASANKHGRNGKNLIIPVPLGTKIFNEDKELVADITESGQEYLALHGGAGGLGNFHFKSSTRRSPNFAKGGIKTKSYRVFLELNCIADVGLIGFPNVGKSTLLSIISKARPKIANYHFTTLYPNIGVVNYKGRNILFADIPGLIEGASDGVGLGHSFLKHISRTRLLVHIIDISESEGRDAVKDFRIINSELKAFGIGLEKKRQIIVLNKCDMAAEEQIKGFRAKVKTKEIIETSFVTHKNIDRLIHSAFIALEETPEEVPEKIVSILEKKGNPREFNAFFAGGAFHLSGQLIENLLRGTVINDAVSNNNFQNKLKEYGVIDRLIEMGIENGDTIKIDGYEFIYER